MPVHKEIDFDESRASELLDVLRASQIMPKEHAEAVAHALVDIAESIERIYWELVPKILNKPNEGAEMVREWLWDIREEFRHIDYHIHDARLTEL